MPKERSLRAALDRHTGRDYKQEKQQKSQKEAAKKRKRSKVEDDDDAEALEEAGGVAIEAADLEAEQEASGSSSEEDEEDPADIDISRIVDSDSDSEDDDEEINQPPKLQSNGVPARSLADQIKGLVAGSAEATSHPQEDEDEDSDHESIALSDISAGPDEADLIPHQRLTINNTAALARALKSFQLPYASLSFSEHQSVTSPLPTSIPDVSDDVELEKALYAQSLSAALAGRKALKAEGVPFTRPTDYFAEMVKSDEHMGKIKARLVDDAQAKRASADAKRQREKKKFGKAEQQERLQARAKEKRDMLDKTKVLKRKRAGAGPENEREDVMFDVAAEEAVEEDKRERRDRERGRGRDGQMGAKRQKKNEKFGFGGKKRGLKRPDAVSSGDMSGYSTKRMKGQVSGRGGKQRPGKSRRQSSRS